MPVWVCSTRGGSNGCYVVGVPMGWCTFLLSRCAVVLVMVCCSCLVQEGLEIQKDVNEGCKAWGWEGRHGPSCLQDKSCTCMLNFFVLPCCTVRLVCLEILYQWYIYYLQEKKKKKQGWNFLLKCPKQRNVSIICKRSCWVSFLLSPYPITTDWRVQLFLFFYPHASVFI